MRMQRKGIATDPPPCVCNSANISMATPYPLLCMLFLPKQSGTDTHIQEHACYSFDVNQPARRITPLILFSAMPSQVAVPLGLRASRNPALPLRLVLPLGRPMGAVAVLVLATRGSPPKPRSLCRSPARRPGPRRRRRPAPPEAGRVCRAEPRTGRGATGGAVPMSSGHTIDASAKLAAEVIGRFRVLVLVPLILSFSCFEAHRLLSQALLDASNKGTRRAVSSLA